MSAENILLQAAEVLEKTAHWYEAVEGKRLSDMEASRKKLANDLATKISGVTGDRLDDDLVNKLASSDPALQSIILNLTGLSHESVDSMGDVSPSTRPKLASAPGELAPEDAAFFEAICED
jgi:hypothetical protein